MNKNELMILHRFDKSVFFKYYVGFLYNYFDTSNHHFITNQVNSHTLSADDIPMVEHFKTIYTKPIKNIRLFVPYAISRLRMTYKSNLLIIHQMKLSDVFFCLLTPWSLKKTIWVIWGGDLYDYRERKSSIRSRIQFIVKKQIVNRIPYVVARVPDYKLLQEWYGSKAKLLLVEPLYSNGEFESATLTIKKDSSTPIKITLGNSATITNHHIEALEILSKFRNEDIQLYIPLVYGDMEYAEIVKTRSKEIFGNKVTILDKFMNPDEYNKHLSTMDIGIFNIDRQQALGNISYLLASGAKIYLDSTSPLWEIFEGFNFQVHPVSNIPLEDFDTFTYLDTNELTYNSQHAKEIYSEKHSVDCWTRVFNLAKEKRP